MMKTKMKPCSKCGCNRRTTVKYWGGNCYYTKITCWKCGHSAVEGYDLNEAIEHWNDEHT
jgi:hypothetical protein